MRLFLPVLALALLLGACSPPGPQPSATLPVVVTNSILADIVKNVAGDAATITTLVGPDGDAHTYEPSPLDGKALVEARIYFENGLHFEPWSEKLFQSSGSKAQRVSASDGIEPIQAPDEPGHEGHNHGESDPHVWNDVTHAIRMTENVREALIQADPQHSALYRERAGAYIQKLRDLDDWVMAQTRTLPVEKRKLVTNHDVFAYFAQRYQFEILGDAINSLSTDGGEPTPAHLIKLAREIKSNGVKTIFGDFSSNPKIIGQVAQESGAAIGPKLYVDSLGAPGSEGDSYEKMMRYNVATIVENLK